MGPSHRCARCRMTHAPHTLRARASRPLDWQGFATRHRGRVLGPVLRLTTPTPPQCSPTTHGLLGIAISVILSMVLHYLCTNPSELRRRALFSNRQNPSFKGRPGRERWRRLRHLHIARRRYCVPACVSGVLRGAYLCACACASRGARMLGISHVLAWYSSNHSTHPGLL